MLNLRGVFVDVVTGETLGYKIGGKTAYTAAVTLEKAKELNVEDIDIVEYLDLDIIESVRGRGDTYAVLEQEELFMSEYEDTPFEKLDGRVALYGHIFKDTAVCTLDGKYAIDRLLIAEERGVDWAENL